MQSHGLQANHCCVAARRVVRRLLVTREGARNKGACHLELIDSYLLAIA
jgi:hypothetical protein